MEILPATLRATRFFGRVTARNLLRATSHKWNSILLQLLRATLQEKLDRIFGPLACSRRSKSTDSQGFILARQSFPVAHGLPESERLKQDIENVNMISTVRQS